MLYAETSAVVAWLLEERRGMKAAQAIAAADAVVASDLTLIEADRALRRVARLDAAGDAAVGAGQRRLVDATATWAIERISPPVVERARLPFLDDAIRSLDAIHLATAVVLRAAGVELDILSLDERVRSNGRALGFRVVPD